MNDLARAMRRWTEKKSYRHDERPGKSYEALDGKKIKGNLISEHGSEHGLEHGSEHGTYVRTYVHTCERTCVRMCVRSPTRLSRGVGCPHFIVLKRGHPSPPEWDLYKIRNSFEKANIYSYKFTAKPSITIKWEAPTYPGA